ncbi:calcium uniporter protein 2, mitochondrial-like [Solanum stenotomum]|uniref:calcium uniporter protein 2, mitochondrial-like n=1 Tax=Solanum stenotomum TaxID=172797 RepID=UPI0020D124A3|nr:calcium uniporter protein 2, mitochondrial-like [Solanum stenotomum]
MAFKKIVAQRLFDSYKISRPSLTTCRICSSTMTKSMASPNPERIAPDPGEGAFFRRSLHRSSLFQSLATSSELRSFPIGEKLRQELRGMDIGRDRIRLDGLISPPQQKSFPEMESELAEEEKFTVADAKKVMRLAQLEVVKSRLRQMENDWISYPEFFQICNGASSNSDQALEFAKMLDQSGIVIVLGNVVFLKPDKVVKAMEGLMPMPLAQPNDPQMMKEFQQMDEKKSAIDKKAESLVQRELWCGLGFFVIQTAAFMRLTFWELTWDVMEPICFYVTSFYCMAGYAFFLRTSKEPTYEGFFHSRFSAKQKKLMKLHNFDLQRYNELRKACDPHSSIPTGNTLTLHSTPMMSTT